MHMLSSFLRSGLRLTTHSAGKPLGLLTNSSVSKLVHQRMTLALLQLLGKLAFLPWQPLMLSVPKKTPALLTACLSSPAHKLLALAWHQEGSPQQRASPFSIQPGNRLEQDGAIWS